MAVNPETGVDYDVDRFAVVRLSDGVILNPNAQWPRTDGGPIVGGNPDIAYYKRVPASAPEVDFRFSLDTVWTLADVSPLPPEGHPRGTYAQSFTAVRRPADELKAQVKDQFNTILREWIPDDIDPEQLIGVSGALQRKAAGTQLDVKDNAYLDKHSALVDALKQNADRRDALFAAVDAEQDYDIEEGWQHPAP